MLLTCPSVRSFSCLFVRPLPNCERDILKTSGSGFKCMQRSTYWVRISKFKVTGGWLKLDLETVFRTPRGIQSATEK